MVKETRITLENVGKINPESIEEYISVGGYKAIQKALKLKPIEVIDEMLKSSLRGRGGAGFSTGLKEQFTSKSCLACEHRYVVCNADEGEPGTFKDRVIMEKDPHKLLEGIMISAYSIGASKAYIYIRAEYFLSIERVQKAINDAKSKNFIGKNIFDSDFSLDIEINLGAGSYLCGEELTLLESLEGKRGYPRIKPPFPAEKGLFGSPTLVNNVETLATITTIIDKGAEWYSKLGTEDAPGTKIFTLSGDIKKPGYVEVEMGITLRQLIFEFGKGIKNDASFKGALLGGAAGTFVDEAMLDTPMSYDQLKAKGATLGSGAIIVFNDTKSISDILQNILEFFKHESCGKCVPCRIGTSQLLLMIDDLKKSKLNKTELINQLIEEATYMAKNSLCPLGQSPILPIKSAFNYFSNEF